ncbi:putative zinc-binding protein [Spirochaetia bacterium 38H-sp]|uniref:Zinc-binding protein n=1 Tax=Rarispira pelagica TaxID=3141764 RepID=A0ABU9UCL4_9SPIR
MSCCCGTEKKLRLVYSCSGAANTGFLADRVYRKLMQEEGIDGTCLAAMGANFSGFVISAQEACDNIVIDGCPVACGKKIFDDKGLSYTHFVMTDFSVEKGKTEITDDIVERISKEIANKIREKVDG